VVSEITASTALCSASRAAGITLCCCCLLWCCWGSLSTGNAVHRNLSLITVVFVAVHVVGAVPDSYVSISLAAAVIPFVPSYEQFWLGLGAAAWTCWRRGPGRRTCRVRSKLLWSSDDSGCAAIKPPIVGP
jgi:hypothetical protein